jgi:hypothetical protein
MKNNLLKKVLKNTAAKLIAAFLMLSSGQSKAALTIINGDFSDLTGLTYAGGGWYNGVPTGWSSNTTALTYNVVDWNAGNFAANLGQLSQTSPSFAPLYQNAGLLDSASIVSLSFDILHFVPGPNVGVGIFNTYNSANYNDWTLLALAPEGGYISAGRFTLETDVPIAANTHVGVAFWQGPGGAAGLDNVSIIPEPTTLDLISLPVAAAAYMVDMISKNIYTCGINPRKFNALTIVY